MSLNDPIGVFREIAVPYYIKGVYIVYMYTLVYRFVFVYAWIIFFEDELNCLMYIKKRGRDDLKKDFYFWGQFCWGLVLWEYKFPV